MSVEINDTSLFSKISIGDVIIINSLFNLWLQINQRILAVSLPTEHFDSFKITSSLLRFSLSSRPPL